MKDEFANLTKSLLHGKNKKTVDRLKKSWILATCLSGVALKIAVKLMSDQ